MLVYKDKSYAGITWHVGAKTFRTYVAAKCYSTIFDEIRVCVNGLRKEYDYNDARNHPTTISVKD